MLGLSLPLKGFDILYLGYIPFCFRNCGLSRARAFRQRRFILPGFGIFMKGWLGLFDIWALCKALRVSASWPEAFFKSFSHYVASSEELFQKPQNNRLISAHDPVQVEDVTACSGWLSNENLPGS